jgi:hypothetical protein
LPPSRIWRNALMILRFIDDRLMTARDNIRLIHMEQTGASL